MFDPRVGLRTSCFSSKLRFKILVSSFLKSPAMMKHNQDTDPRPLLRIQKDTEEFHGRLRIEDDKHKQQ